MSTAELETTEGYKEYSITVMVRRLEDKTFTAAGWVRKSNSALTGLPFETTFETCERHLTEDAARESAFAFARKKIDGVW